MSTKEGEHQRATMLMQTGYLPGGPIRYPSLGSLFSKELLDPRYPSNARISIAGRGTRFAPPTKLTTGSG